MGLLKDGTRKVNHLEEGIDGFDEVDEYGYSIEFVSAKFATLAAQTSGHVALIHIEKRREEDLGIKLVGSKNAKVDAAFVSDIAKKSPAEKVKLIKVGDQLLEINGKTLYGRTLLQASNVLRANQMNEKISLVTIRRKDAHSLMATEAESKAQMEKEASAMANFNDMLSAPTKGAASSSKMTGQSTASVAGPSTSKVPSAVPSQGATASEVQPSISSSSPNVITVMEIQKASSQNRPVEEAKPAVTYPPRQKRPVLPPGSIKVCVLQKQAVADLGFALYGKPQPEDLSKSEIFITKMVPGGVAWLEGSLDNGDQILGIDEKLFVDATSVEDVQAVLDKAEGSVEILYRKKPHLLKNRALPTNFATMVQHLHQEHAPPRPNSVAPREAQPAVSPVTSPTSPLSQPIRSIPFLEYNPRKNDIKTNEETWILLDKGVGPPNQHVGLSLVGGRLTQLKYIVINGIVADSPAEKDGRLRPGDIVLQVDEWDLRNATHQEAVQRLNDTKRQVYVLVRRDRHGICEERLNDVFSVDLVKRPGHGLGICIGPRAGGGVSITRLIPDSAAAHDGRLTAEDVLLEMNGTDLRDMPIMEVAFLLKMSMGLVVLTVARNRWRRVCNVTTIEKPKTLAIQPASRSLLMLHSPDSTDCDVPHSHSHGMLSFITDQLDRARQQRIAYRRYRSRSRSITPTPGGTFTSTSSGGSSENLASPTRAFHSIVQWFSREHDYVVENQYEVFDLFLTRNAQGKLGIRIFSGQFLDDSLMRVHGSQYPFAVANLIGSEPAKQSNMIKIGDRIVSVNEQLVACMTRDEVLALLDGEANSAVQVRFERTSDEAVVVKVPRIEIEAPPELSIKKTTVHRGGATLGLSLVGGLDEKMGRFVPFQVKSLLEASPALKSGVKPGDCVLAVNDVPMDGLTHEQAVYLLKRSQGQTLLTLLTY